MDKELYCKLQADITKYVHMKNIKIQIVHKKSLIS
jgi:hypothetical protein